MEVTGMQFKDYHVNRTHRLFLFLGLFSLVTSAAFVWSPYHFRSWPAIPPVHIRRVANSSKENIWLVETSGKAALNARQACSIESAAIYNPEFNVRLLSTGNVGEGSCPYYRVLLGLPNFIWARVNASDVLDGSPIKELYLKFFNPGSPYATPHLSDFLRYLLLWKQGGVYLDTDVIVTKPLTGIRNSVVYENIRAGEVASAVLFFDAKYPVLETLMKWCASMYLPDDFAGCGPVVVSKLPGDIKLSRLVTFLDNSTFMAIHWSDWKALFSPNETLRVLRATKNSYGVHFWNFLSHRTPIVPRSGCAMDYFAESHCPRVYKVASQQPYF